MMLIMIMAVGMVFVHCDLDDDVVDDQDVGCTLNVDGTLVAQLPSIDHGKTKRRTTVSKITFKEGGWGHLRSVMCNAF